MVVRRGFVVALVLGGALALSAPVAGARLHTRATIFRAFDATGAPTIPVKSRSGSCFSGSDAINRNDAWRCFSGNLLFDPCFSSSLHPGVVVCPNRAVNGGVEIHLRKKLPRKFADRGRPSLKHQPWDIQLASGRHCAFSSGASNVVHGVRLNYFCGPGTRRGLWGYPRRRVQPWTIRIAPFDAKTLRKRAAIRHVWM